MITLLLLIAGTFLIAGAIMIAALSAVMAMERARGAALRGYVIACALGTAAAIVLVTAGGRF